MANTPALEIHNLEAWYGESHVLHGVDIVVQPGEVVTLLGRNGAGRTTTITPALLITLALLSAVAPFAIDLYLPAFPTMVDDLHTTPTGVTQEFDCRVQRDELIFMGP